ncbi:Hypp1761 [Branchiostoma lanceolatum]|uniref:Hypp1761 protein n=1 Tax=Branchiostoma lanceolatum TaxID=7740 RepID=A0A8J9ZMF3_BRALA|nr:Hypp1761 [Branchiostoma lanceolatum]
MVTSPLLGADFSPLSPDVDHQTTQNPVELPSYRRPARSIERCPAHSRMLECDRVCRPTCTNPRPVCVECPSGHYGCVCEEGYLWQDGVCVPQYKCTETTEFVQLQQEVQQLARDLPRTLAELGLSSVVQHVQELRTNATEVSRSGGWWRSSHDCHCGREADFNRLGEGVCDGACNSRCRGNKNQFCGGRFRMSVYKIDAGPAPAVWYQTGNTTTLQYRGEPQDRPFALTTPVLDRNTAIPIQSTLVNLTANIEAFPSRYPATTEEGVPDLVPDYTALLASFQAPGLRLTSGTNTVLELDQHFAIKSYPCSLEYNPGTNGRSRRGIMMRIIVVSYDPYEVMIEIICY